MPWNIIIMVALMVVSAVITALTAKAPPPGPDPALLKDFNLPQVAEGTAQVVVFGDVWLTEWQVLWYGDLRSEGISPPGSGSKK